jgi:microcystin degradation protein MlrC
MRIFTATLGTETNTFAPLPTNLESFRDLVCVSGADITTGRSEPSAAGRALLSLRQDRPLEIIHGLSATAQPGGVTTRAAYEHLRGQLLDDLAAAGKVNGVLLNLHGAMIADGYLDCEGDILRRVRAHTGSDIPVCVVLDPHCHLSEEMLQYADAISCYKEYPHTDVEECLIQMADLLVRIVDGRHKPVQSVFDCRMISILHTREEPVRSIIDRIRTLEQTEADILSISIIHGFPWGDSPDMGTRVLVITDAAPEKGARIAREIGMDLFAHRDSSGKKLLTLEEATREALRTSERPLVIADSSDNPGGGAPSDSMRLIRSLMDKGVTNAAAAFIWDPGAVAIAHRAGEGARLPIRIGGKTSVLCGPPLDLDLTVKRVMENLSEVFAGLTWNTGPAAVVEGGGFELVLTTNRIQCFTPEAFRQAGIRPEDKSILVVKSSQHFRSAFEPLAGRILYAEPPGVLDTRLDTLPFRHVQRPRWPFDPDPFGSAGGQP